MTSQSDTADNNTPDSKVWLTALLTATALIAFAANSVLCRLALSDLQGGASIDAASFTAIRLLSGALVLVLLLQRRSQRLSPGKALKTNGSWLAAVLLFSYAACFSYAYNSLDTATGALILFGAVQLSIIMTALLHGNHLQIREWLGLALAMAGLVYLLLPGLNAPPLEGFVLMAIAGIAWGGYTLKGKGSKDPLAATAANFSRALPLILVLLPGLLWHTQLSFQGVVLAVVSGALASGIGYSIWYQALKGLSVTQAGVVQLLVPVIAAAGGILFAGESLSVRLLVAAALILGGIGLTLIKRR